MPLTADDIKFFAAKKMTDDADAGGARGATVLQDGTNNVFPGVTEDERLSGSARLRKVYPSTIATDNSALLSAAVSIHEVPSDPKIHGALFAYGDATTTRAQFEAALRASLPTRSWTNNETISIGGQITYIPPNTPAVDVQVGDHFLFEAAGVVAHRARVTAVNQAAPAAPGSIQFAPAFAAGGAGKSRFTPSLLRAYATTVTTAALNVSDTVVPLASNWAQVVPVDPTAAYPVVELTNGIGSGWAQHTRGQVPCVEAGDRATIFDVQARAPETVSNSQTIDCGRTNLAELTVTGSNGLLIARFLANGPVPSGVGCTANLAAGTVNFTAVGTYSQPVTIRHRIEEVVSVLSLSGVTATLATPLTRAYPSGARFSTAAPLGDLQAVETLRFSQQAWTKVWSDNVIGNAAPQLYDGSLALTSDGAELDRWAIVFTSATQFSLFSERLGQVASGNVATDFTPLNPTTSQPYFTLFAGGWRTPAVGNVLRINTKGSYAPVWALRSVRPGAAAGTDRVALKLRGGVGA